MKYSAMLVAAGVLSAGTAFAQAPIKIGAMYPLTGGGAVYGVPATSSPSRS
jgi:branched-chain amino acid transport system substrate-binding protein